MDRTKPKPVAPQLPKDVVQHIFNITAPGSGHPVLSLQDRVRALAVCRAWKDYLDPKQWPIIGYDLNGSQEAHHRVAGWICATQPALRALSMANFDQPQLLVTLASVGARTALTALSLYGEAEDILDALTPVCLFSKLTWLTLTCRYPDETGSQLDLATLQPLSALEHLHCCSWARVELRGGRLLPQLTSLYLLNGGGYDLDAALPSLQYLSVNDGVVQLEGERLQLPRLAKLRLVYTDAAVDWPALPQLAKLTVEFGRIMSLETLSTLQQLTSVSLVFEDEAVSSVIQAAPPSVRELSLHGLTPNWQPPPFDGLPELTRLVCSGSLDILAHLGPCSRLQELSLYYHSAADLAVEHFGWLCGLTGLRRLCFGGKLEAGSAAGRLMQVKKVLPAHCVLEQPLTE